MCGIAGIINYSGAPVEKSLISEMLNTILHRGPDGQGVTTLGGMAFGHVRLSIIDLEGSPQPLSNEDGTIWVTFNGEIYNYKELREKLILKGHQFKTNGDTETLVHLYEEYGEGMLQYLQGMFAFAIWDENKKTTLIARDRLGIKPLYYFYDNKNFVFASECKAILKSGKVTQQLDLVGLNDYLTFRSTPAPHTLFEGISKLSPGHYITIKNNKVEDHQYWDIPLQNTSSNNFSVEEVTSNIEDLLKLSIKRRMISDVPVGCFLSGGIDSSLIVAMMSGQSNFPVNTYSVGFNNFKSSETGFARIVADHCNTEHHELILEEDCFSEHLESLTWIRDAPLSEPADVPLYLLSKMASNEVKVILSGEGSDELFGGYPKYAYDKLSQVTKYIPSSLLSNTADFLSAKYRRHEIALRALSYSEDSMRWANWFAPFSVAEKALLLKDNSPWDNPYQKYSRMDSGASSLSRMLYGDCKIWLPDNLLDRGDRMTMAASIEGRVPFLDYELVEYAFSVSDKFKISGRQRKKVIKDIARKYLPNEIIDRPKIGFAVPLDSWFKGKLKDMSYDIIFQKNGISDLYFNNDVVRAILDDHMKNKKNNAIKIWTLLGISIWYNRFFNQTI